jgi:D-tyrosyl-tRNA(Tyr) deacylase
MRLVIQRVRRAEVRVEDVVVGAIQAGAVVLVGVGRGDTPADAEYLARKTAALRIYADGNGKLNDRLDPATGAILAVSQFTLYGDCRKGNRPSYLEAADAEDGRRGYEWYVEALRRTGLRVETGRYREHMVLCLENDGPVTLVLESRGRTPA